MTRWLDNLIRSIGWFKAHHGKIVLIILAIVLAATILIVTLLLTPANAKSLRKDFYAVGLNYQVYESQIISGTLTTVKAESSHGNSGGIEQDVVVQCDDDRVVVEFTNWFYGDTTKVGIIIQDSDKQIFVCRVLSEIGKPYHYYVLTSGDGIITEVFDSNGNSLIYNKYPRQGHIVETNTYLEYWRIVGQPCFYYGYATINETGVLQVRNDFYRVSNGLPFNMTFIHHKWGTKYYDKGEIDDR